ncbi:hypothetical protein ACFSND_04020 [Brevibacillus brevis]|uniref:hypothetical protein n=1 Tax=Brevibacillus brevis TaxID=1393 RepID=UPI0036314402
MAANQPLLTSRIYITKRSQKITIPNLKRVVSVTVNTGKVTHSVNGNEVTINVSEARIPVYPHQQHRIKNGVRYSYQQHRQFSVHHQLQRWYI